MNTRISTALAAAALGLATLAMPGTGYAGNVGYGSCTPGQAAAITAAGHTPVAVTAPTAPVLATLSALLYGECGSYVRNAEIDAAVSNGMTLIIHDWSVSKANELPGATGLIQTFATGADIDLPTGSPIITGPGGTLSNASLDGGNWSNHGYTAAASLPAGSIALTTTVNAAQVVTFAYAHGAGRVVYSTTPLNYYFSGGGNATVRANMANVYAPNLIAWAAGPTFTTCAAEGYTGSKLSLCHQICEIDQTPAKLTSLIRLYVAAYREQPACAR